MKNFLAFLLVSLPFITIAQSLDELKQSKEIEWVIETDIEYFFEKDNALSFGDTTTRSGLSGLAYRTELLKIDPFQTCMGTSSRFLTYQILDDLQSGRAKIYDLIDSTNLLKKQMFLTIDTVYSYDPETFQEYAQVVETSIFSFMKSYKVKQLWYYHKNEKKVRNKVLEIVPLLWKKQRNGKIRKEESFRIRFDQNEFQTARPDINQKEIVWMKTTTDRVNLLDAKVIKGNVIADFQQLFWEMPRGEEIKIYSVENSFYCAKKQSLSDLIYDTSEAVDTIITFDSETYAESITVEKRLALTYENILGHQVNQLWFYNFKTKTLNSYLLEMGPVMKYQIERTGERLPSFFDFQPHYKTLYFLKF